MGVQEGPGEIKSLRVKGAGDVPGGDAGRLRGGLRVVSCCTSGRAANRGARSLYARATVRRERSGVVPCIGRAG